MEHATPGTPVSYPPKRRGPDAAAMFAAARRITGELLELGWTVEDINDALSIVRTIARREARSFHAMRAQNSKDIAAAVGEAAGAEV